MEYVLSIISIVLILTVIVLLAGIKNQQSQKMTEQNKELRELLDKTKQEINSEVKETRQELMQYVQNSFQGLGDLLATTQKQSAESQDKRLLDVSTVLGQMDQRLKSNSMQSEQKLENIRTTMEVRLSKMQDENGKKLDEMRATVDEKLQKTLEDRIGQSFRTVSERLEQVYKGLGEMQNLAIGVGDLKKVLSNVKTRGILGEIQLGAILEQILSPEQYAENISTKKGSKERVEFAVKLPGMEEESVYLPIDAKFPADTYAQLMDAYDSGDSARIEVSGKLFESKIKSFAKDIHDKYIEPPQTTDFGIMFLPVEGIYAEAVRRGMVEVLQREYKINISGPTTMAALLNSLQMGFKTLAIQKHSSEVWNVLGAVKTEFDKFGNVLVATQQRLNQANSELDKLVGARTRKIQSKLRNIAALSEKESGELLGIETEEEMVPLIEAEVEEE